MKNLLIILAFFTLTLSVSAQTKNVKIEKEIVDFALKFAKRSKRKTVKVWSDFSLTVLRTRTPAGKLTAKTDFQ